MIFHENDVKTILREIIKPMRTVSLCFIRSSFPSNENTQGKLKQNFSTTIVVNYFKPSSSNIRVTTHHIINERNQIRLFLHR